MQKIKITLYNGDIVDVHCSVLFMKHIEAHVCLPEETINKKLSRDGADIFQQQEAGEAVDLYTYNTLPYPFIHVVNFHRNDLPFTYSSVDSYGRSMIRFVRDKSTADQPLTKIATAVHGPGAGLDASEAMERMILAFADELDDEVAGSTLEEIIFVERNKSVFERLRERMEFLVRSNVLVYEESKTYLVAGARKAVRRAAQPPVPGLRERHVFVAMPFDRNFDDVYLYGIKQAVEKNGRVSERTDQEFFTGDIIQRIKLRIRDAELIVADISGNNPNVFYEIGLANGMDLVNTGRSGGADGDGPPEKPIVFITQEDKVPFDIQTQNRIRYNRFAIKELEEKLADAIGDILRLQSGETSD